jgi:hypothetical protein
MSEMNEGALQAFLSKAWLYGAAFVGSITGAYMLGHKTRMQYAASTAIGFFAAVFVAPGIVEIVLPDAAANSPLVGLTYYMVSIGAMFFLPPFLAFVAKVAADPIGWWRGLKKD